MSDEKTFTQEQLDAVVKERLAKEKAKYCAALAEKEKELAAREFKLKARETLIEKGISVDLLDAMNTSSPEAFERSLSILEAKIKTAPAPSGTAAKVSTGGAHDPDSGTAEADSIRAAMGLK